MPGYTAGRRIGGLRVRATRPCRVEYRPGGGAWRPGGLTPVLIEGLEPGSYEVRGTPLEAGYAPVFGPVTVVPEGEGEVEVLLGVEAAVGSLSLLLAAPGADPALGFGGIGWSLSGPAARSGSLGSAEGLVSLGGLPPGSYQVSAAASGFASGTLPVQITGGQVTGTSLRLTSTTQTVTASRSYAGLTGTAGGIVGGGAGPDDKEYEPGSWLIRSFPQTPLYSVPAGFSLRVTAASVTVSLLGPLGQPAGQARAELRMDPPGVTVIAPAPSPGNSPLPYLLPDGHPRLLLWADAAGGSPAPLTGAGQRGGSAASPLAVLPAGHLIYPLCAVYGATGQFTFSVSGHLVRA